MSPPRRAFRASFLHCTADPVDRPDAVTYLPDGWLVVEDGLVASLEPAGERRPAADDYVDLSGRLVVPGFVDTHVHYPQTDIVASYGSQLLDWLERYTFPAEARFDDPDIARETARFFLDELLANGTTTALVFATAHRNSVERFFEEADARGLRMIAGQVLMDRNAPDALTANAPRAIDECEASIQAWHGRGRLGYAVTPRFAPTSSDAQLDAAGRLLERHRDRDGGLHLHTHLAENAAEIEWVRTLFPNDADYLAVYERHGLVSRRSVFAHALHLDDGAWQRLGRANASVAHCPCSNLFIGSGLFDLDAATRHAVTVGIGSDVGGGDSFSLLRVLNEAYKVQQLQGHALSPERALYLATLGGAKALDLGDRIGSFQTGFEADFVALDPRATPLLARRTAACMSWRERLFAMLMLGDDRLVDGVWIMGQRARRRERPERTS